MSLNEFLVQAEKKLVKMQDIFSKVSKNKNFEYV
jgi:hypothetical protein